MEKIYHAANRINNEIEHNKERIDTLYKCAEEAALAFLNAKQKIPDLQISEMSVLVSFVQDYFRSAEDAQTRIDALETAIDKIESQL